MPRGPTLSLLLLGAMTIACAAPGVLSPVAGGVLPSAQAGPDEPAIAPPRRTAAPTEAPPQHRIAVRIVGGTGEFYDRVTGARFVPRGANYVVMGWQQNRAGESYLSHATFGPGFYDRTAAEKALQKLHADGYDVVRVFLETTTTTSITGAYGLSSEYLGNVADFLRLAAVHGIYVVFVSDWLPDSDPYNQIVARECCETFDSSNAVHLSASGVEASERFYADFVRELIEREAPLEAVFSFNVSNELAFDANEPPLAWTSGTVTLGNGQTYDMANPQDKKRIIDEGLVFYIDRVRTAILEVDPTALVGVGFFQPHGPNPTRIGDPRVIRTYAAIWQSQADYIDLHAYPGFELTLAEYVENYEINGMQEKPIVMGEFGAFRGPYPTAQEAALALQAWQIESCTYGFDGWLVWTWDNEFGGEMYSALTDGGAINGALAPVLRPDPCR